MKKYFKRFLSVFPAFLILILNIIPLSSFADAYYGAEGLTRPDNYSKDLSNLSGSDFSLDDDDKPYILMRYNGYRFTYIAVQCQGDYSFEEKDGIYTIVFSEVYCCYGLTDGGRWTTWEDGWSHYWSTFTIIYDTNTQKLIRNDLPYGTFGSDVTAFETNVNQNTSKILVDDTIYPDFSQDPVSRFIDGFSMDYGQIDVKNESNDDYYIAMFIVQSNKSVNFIGNTELNSDQSGKCWTNAAGDILFPFATDEYFYTKSMSLNNKVYQEDVGQSMFKVYAPSAVHPLKAGKSYSFYFGFNQVNLVKNHTYDLVLYAYAPYEGQNIHSLDFCPNVFEYVNMQEVYRRTFTMAESTPYDSNRPDLATAQGTVYGFNSYNPDATFDSINGFEVNHDPDSSLGGSSYKPIKDSFSNLQYSYGNGSFNFTGGSSGANFSSLIPVTSNYFNFLAVSLGYFPQIFLDVVSLALISFLVIAIIRRLH